MKLGIAPDNLLERLALLSGLFPPGIFECWFGMMLARTVMAATRLEVFESLAAAPLTAQEVAQRCGTHPGDTEKLLNALVGVEAEFAQAEDLEEAAEAVQEQSFRQDRRPGLVLRLVRVAGQHEAERSRARQPAEGATGPEAVGTQQVLMDLTRRRHAQG